jgi:colanic acid/amylovoran biosynthesis protein
MKILIANTHSVLNSGDAAIVLAQCHFLRRFFPGVEISLISRTPDLDRVLYTPLGIEVLPPLIPAPSVFSGRLKQFQESVRNVLDLGAKSELFRIIKTSDLVIASGGGYFWSNRKHFPGPMFLQNLLPLALAGRMQKPLIFFPQSFGPLFNPAAGALLRKVLEAPAVVRIFARESQSRDFTLQLLGENDAAAKVDLAPDMAFLFEPRSAEHRPDVNSIIERMKNMQRPLAVLTLRFWDFPEAKNAAHKKKMQADYLSALTEICANFHRRFNGAIAILPQVRGPGTFEDDRPISAELLERLGREIVEEALFMSDLPEAADPSLVQGLIAAADIVIATRFHSAIFATNAGVPVFSIGYQPKSHETLKQLGLEAFTMPIDNLDPSSALQMIEKLLSRDDRQKVALMSQVLATKKILTAKLEEALLPFRKN